MSTSAVEDAAPAVGPPGRSIARFRQRVVRVSVLARLLVVATIAVGLLSQGSVDWKVAALVALATANVAYLMSRVPWEELLHRPSGRRWLYTWSVLDVVLITLGILNTGGARSELFGLYVLAAVLSAAIFPPRGQAGLLGLMLAGYLIVVAVEAESPGLAHVVVRLGGLGLVAYVASFLSRELLGQTRAHDEARAESESRAALLAGVAAAARTMSTLDPPRVLDTVVEAAVGLGFDGAELCLFDEDAGTWRVAHQRGVEAEPSPLRPIEAGAAGLVHARGATVVLDDHSGWPLSVRPALEAGYRHLVACPVWSGGGLVAALVAGSTSRPAPYPHEVECLDLLAAHAGAAFENARLYAERRDFEAKLAHQAFHDALTGLPNRALFLDRLDQALARARRDGEPVGVLFLDLDGFKAVNDELGHERGDELLAAVSQRLQGCLRPGDTLARFGGDEFTVLLEKLRSDADGIDVAERLLHALADPFSLSGHQVNVSASIGASFARAPFPEGVDPLREADQAMYRAKERGDGRWEVFRAEMNAVAVYRLELEAELRGALDRGELSLDYQPRVDVGSGRITGVEALARWRHATRGAVAPSEFVPIAARAGMSVVLGAWVLEEACRQVRDWDGQGLPRLEVSVNVAADQLVGPGFAAHVGELLARSGLAPGRLTLETSEEVVLGRGGALAGPAADLARLGVRLAVDDFGRGRSALRELTRLPLHEVKVDRSLVAGVAGGGPDRAVVRSLVALAADLGIHVSAAGVETADQLDHLRALGCRTAQGFWFSPPLGAGEVARLLRAPEVPVPAP
ncbi:MAG: putative bifunctional diguanylate cyclase/phosphodiesterase [Acidimicrobiia bacterium]